MDDSVSPPRPDESAATVPLPHVPLPRERVPFTMSSLDSGPLLTPEQLQALMGDGYIVGEFIGKGGMGAVYKGTQVRLHRTVAIKIMRHEKGLDPAFEERFRREALTMARLNHPNIVTVIDCGMAGADHLYIVMEFVDGTDLLSVIRKGRMSQEEVLKLLPQVCDALQFAHDQGIVHRDIKPSNVMLTRDGRVKMADFGLAKSFDSESTLLTQTGTGIGTPDYAAPEQFRNAGQVDHRADIYSLGVMIYEMITGFLPRGAWSLPSKQAAVDPRWDEIVSQAMDPDPLKRPATASEVKMRLSQIRRGSNGSGAGTLGPEIRRPRPRGETDSVLHLPSRFAAGGLVGVLGTVAMVAAVLFLVLKKPSSVSAPIPVRTEIVKRPAMKAGAAAATKDAPFVNSLGMRFVPVPITGGPSDGQRVLFSVWETRVQDYDVYAKSGRDDWPRPEFAQGPTHPAVNMNWENAQDFCTWLTRRERAVGLIRMNEVYRLPTDHEWSCAAGIGLEEEASNTPRAKNQRLGGVYSWGSQWPPPAGVGNFAGEELRPSLEAGKYGYIVGLLTDYRDDYVETAPVASYPANVMGLHDMSGNVWEWCGDWYDEAKNDRVMRGASWGDRERGALLCSNRYQQTPVSRNRHYGFRCVLVALPDVR